MRSSSGLCTPAPVAGLRSKLATQTTCKTPWTFFVDKEPHSSAPRQDMANVSERVVRRHPGLRHPAYIYRRRRIAALGILAFILVLVVFLAGACGPGATHRLQGDPLGPEPAESARETTQHTTHNLDV